MQRLNFRADPYEEPGKAIIGLSSIRNYAAVSDRNRELWDSGYGGIKDLGENPHPSGVPVLQGNDGEEHTWLLPGNCEGRV